MEQERKNENFESSSAQIIFQECKKFLDCVDNDDQQASDSTVMQNSDISYLSMIKEQESELEQSIIMPDQKEHTSKCLVKSAAQPAKLKAPGSYKLAQSAVRSRFLSPAAHACGKPNYSANNTDDGE